jgi:hypothetical protein
MHRLVSRSFVSHLHGVEDLHELLETVHLEQIVQLLIRIDKDDFALPIPQQLEQAQDFADSGTVHKGYIPEIDDDYAHTFFHYPVETALEQWAVLEGYLIFDPNYASVAA